MTGYKWSAHALDRASERFPNKSIDQLNCLLDSSKRPTGSQLKMIKSACRKSYKMHMANWQGRYYRVSLDVVFVVGAGNPEQVITLFALPPKIKKQRMEQCDGQDY